MRIRANSEGLVRRIIGGAVLLLAGTAHTALGEAPTSIFAPHSTPAFQVQQLSIFVLVITGLIFAGVSALLVYALVKFRARPGDTTEPPQVFGSMQIELAWTIIPVLHHRGAVPGYGAGAVLGAGCAEAGDCTGCDGGRAPVLVGVPLSAVRRGDRE